MAKITTLTLERRDPTVDATETGNWRDRLDIVKWTGGVMGCPLDSKWPVCDDRHRDGWDLLSSGGYRRRVQCN